MAGTPARLTLTAPDDPALSAFDDVIDVRSPAEFADDHLPGAINLPVLDDAQRAQVGTIYKQVSPFDARKLGAALIAASAARHLQGPLAGRTGGWQPLVYCWRGGMRSGSLALIFAQIGWRVTIVEGGYKAWRTCVVTAQDALPPHRLVVLDGNTGSAKTALLHALAAQGVQVLDLEGLANHRGSLFGAMPGGQPAQRLFEGRLAVALSRLNPARPVVVEAESSRIGDRSLPRGLWAALTRAPRLRIDAPLAERAAHCARDYALGGADPDEMAGLIARLRPLHPAARVAPWVAQAQAQDGPPLAAQLMHWHYDPRYASHRARYADREVGVVATHSLAPDALPALARRVAEEVDRLIARPQGLPPADL